MTTLQYSKNPQHVCRICGFVNAICFLGALPLVVEELSNAEYSFPYFAVILNWFVPCPKPLSRIQRIFHIFFSSVWVAVVVVLFLVTVASCCLAKQSNDIRSYTTMSSALYNIWAVTVGVPVTGIPNGLRLMFLFVVFVWYCSEISAVFQTFFMSFLVDPGYKNPLKSLDEVLGSGTEIFYTNGFDIIFSVTSVLTKKEVF